MPAASLGGDGVWSSVRTHLPTVQRRTTGGEEREAKRRKFGDEIEEKISIVKDAMAALYGRTDESRSMLEHICSDALGPGTDERDEDQKQCVRMLGGALDELRGRLIREAEMREDIRLNPEKARAEIQSAMSSFREKLMVSEKDVTIRHKALRDARSVLGCANSELEASIAAHEKAKKELQGLESELQELQATCADHFTPIKQGSWIDSQEKMKHISELMPIFRKFEYEQSLIAAFQKAADHKPGDRGHFDQVTMECAEKDFAEGIHRLEATIKAREPGVAQAEDGVRCADDARENASQREREAAIELGTAIREKRENQLQKDEAQKYYDEFPEDDNALQALLAASKQALSDFSNGPLQAYLFLRDRVAALSL